MASTTPCAANPDSAGRSKRRKIPVRPSSAIDEDSTLVIQNLVGESTKPTVRSTSASLAVMRYASPSASPYGRARSSGTRT